MSYFDRTSERLEYRRLTENDISLWESFFVNNDRTRFVGGDQFPHLSPLEKATNWITQQMRRYDTDGLGQLAVVERSSGKFIGVAGIIVRDIDGTKEYEVTYSLLPEFWGRGYATEAAVSTREFAFEHLDCDSVISIIHEENRESENVATKNGMTRTARMEFMGMPVYVYRRMKP